MLIWPTPSFPGMVIPVCQIANGEWGRKTLIVIVVCKAAWPYQIHCGIVWTSVLVHEFDVDWDFAIQFDLHYNNNFDSERNESNVK
jgi:hypothetical protein